MEASKARVVDLEAQLIAATEKIATLSKLCFDTSSEKKGKKSEPEGAPRTRPGSRQIRVGLPATGAVLG